MKVLDLFSGIGGFSLGLERAGMETIAFCEIEPYCRRVLAKHWPDVPIHEDIAKLDGRQYRGTVDVVCGGFPCQDISAAGKGAGIRGERSGLWSEYARIIGEVRPRYIIVENVAALLGRGLGVVLGDLAALGFDAEWHCIPASAVGAPHRRDRVWIIAYPNSDDVRNRAERDTWRRLDFQGKGLTELRDDGSTWNVAHLDGQRFEARGSAAQGRAAELHVYAKRCGQNVADTNSDRCSKAGQSVTEARRKRSFGNPWWFAEPDVDRVANGVPARVDRLKSLGNAVVPQVVEVIGRAIMEADQWELG